MTEAKQEFLSGKEHDDYISDISGAMNNVIAQIIDIADKHNVNRDNAMQHFSELLNAMVLISTFQNFQKDGD